MNSWSARFASLIARKTRDAEAATLHPYSSELDCHDEAAAPIGNAWTMRLFDGPFYLERSRDARLPACTLVFVQSRDGNTGAKDPSTLGGGETDKHLIYEGLSRVAADAVMSGAETIRGGNTVLSVWHPELVALRESLNKPRHPVQVIATLRGLDVESGLMFNLPEVPVVLLTVADTAASMRRALAARPWIQLIVMRGASDLTAAFEQLRARGIDRISAIGGRHIATQLIDAGLVQDICLTTAARPGGEPGTPIRPEPFRLSVLLQKHGTGAETGIVFEHARLLK